MIMNKPNILLFKAEQIQRDSNIDHNVTLERVRDTLLYVQDSIIERVVGTCLYNQLKELVCSGDICLEEYKCYRDLLDNYLFPLAKYAVAQELMIPLSYKIRNAGVVQNTSDGLITTQANDIKYLIDYYRTRVEFYINRAVAYLCCRHSCFKQLCCCGGCCANQPPFNRDYKVGFNLQYSIKKSDYETLNTYRYRYELY